jgi:hypothetical protein
VKTLIHDIVTQLGIKPLIAINLVERDGMSDELVAFRQEYEA